MILVDTGPIVAVISSSDSEHIKCCEALKSLTPPLTTSWPVITEAQWLLRANPAHVKALFLMLENNIIQIQEIDSSGVKFISDFLFKFRKMGVQLADASLVYLAEKFNAPKIFTLDKKDFSIYRFKKSRGFEIVP